MQFPLTSFTRISFWLTLFVLVAIGILALYVRFTTPKSVITFEPKANVIDQPNQTPAYQIVSEFANVLKLNSGRILVAESELPYPRETIRQAIISSPNWAKDYYAPGGAEFFGALLVELENFVPVPVMISVKTNEDIWSNQKRAISLLGFTYRIVSYSGPKPIPIGEANNALKSMLYERGVQYTAMVADFALIVFLGVKLLLRLINFLLHRPERWSGWGLFLFCVIIWWPLGYSMEFVARIDMFFENFLLDVTLAGIRLDLILTLGILAPLLASSVVFDLLVCPGMGSMPVLPVKTRYIPVLPVKPRYISERIPAGVRITIPAHRNWFVIVCGCLSLVGLVFNLTSEFTEFMSQRVHIRFDDIVSTLISHMVLALIILMFMLWQLFGQEIIEVVDRVFIRRLLICGIGIKQEYSIDHLRNFCAMPMDANEVVNARWFPVPFGAAAGPFMFDYDARIIRFGGYLNNIVVKEILEILRPYIPKEHIKS